MSPLRLGRSRRRVRAPNGSSARSRGRPRPLRRASGRCPTGRRPSCGGASRRSRCRIRRRARRRRGGSTRRAGSRRGSCCPSGRSGHGGAAASILSRSSSASPVVPMTWAMRACAASAASSTVAAGEEKSMIASAFSSRGSGSVPMVEPGRRAARQGTRIVAEPGRAFALERAARASARRPHGSPARSSGPCGPPLPRRRCATRPCSQKLPVRFPRLQAPSTSTNSISAAPSRSAFAA